MATFDRLNPWYYADAPKTVRPLLDLVRRTSTFDEVQGGLDETNALFEARRCLSCGHCTFCDTCMTYCPDGLIRRTQEGYEVLYEYCKGCGICVYECPRSGMEMVNR